MHFDMPENWDVVADVVIVGYGGAGAVAAITASDLGSSVVILEKTLTGGGNTLISGGGMLAPTDMRFAEYVETLCGGLVEREIIDTFVREGMNCAGWMRDMGGDARVFKPSTVSYVSGPLPGASFPWLPGSQFMEKLKVYAATGERDGAALWKFLADAVEQRPLRILTSTPAEELLINRNGEVIGVSARSNGRRLSVKANKAVVLACGGFQHNDAMVRESLPCRPFFDFGNPCATGDGVRMAQKVGAALWHMPANSTALGLKVPEYESAFHLSFLTDRFIFVNRSGKRFLDEIALEDHELATRVNVFHTDRFSYPHIPAYAVLDETAIRKGPLYEGHSGYNKTLYNWSRDNSVEVDKGWIAKADSVPELARRLNVDESGLKETVSSYNDYCRSGKDADFGRSGETLAAIDTPPFYGIELWPCLLNPQGGPRHDGEARVLDPDGKPIPRLYSAGELGSIWAFIYQGSGNLTECVVFGRIAGGNAASETPWG